MGNSRYARLASITAAMLCVAAVISAQPPAGTPQVAGEPLALRASGTRSRFFGVVDLYSVGIYTAAPVSSTESLRDSAMVKAVRVAVLYDGRMPGTVPADWWRELEPALTPDQEQRLRNTFSLLSTGDDIWITYAPREGTRMVHGGTTVVSDDGDGLMNAVLDLWLGPNPVSQDLHQTLSSALRRRR